MLKAKLKSVEGEILNVGFIESVNLKREESAPCDQLEIVFLCEITSQISEILLTDSKGEIFRGVVDEQIVSYSDKVQTKIVARSMEALLVDNEACPEVFHNPSSALIFSRYAKVGAIKTFPDDNRFFEGTLKVYKGDSLYTVLKKFCEKVYGVAPFVKGNELCVFSEDKESEVLFSDALNSGVPFKELEVKHLPCEIISRVNIKTHPDGNYDRILRNEDLSCDLPRVRFVDASSLSSSDIKSAERLIAQSVRRSTELSLVAKGRHSELLRKAAKVETKRGVYEGFYVSSLKYTLKNRQEQTLLTLRRKEC